MGSPIHLRSSPEGSDFQKGELLFIGTATVLIRYGGFTILTDPNFLHQGDHAKLGYGLRSRRLTDPALDVEQLPPVDFIVLSHHHGDHFDEVAARDLDKSVLIITNEHAARKLERQGFQNVRALRTWETQEIVRNDSRVSVTSLPAKHAPNPLGLLLPSVMGSMLEFSDGARAVFRLYITGETLLHDGLQEIANRYPDIDLGLIHLGGTRVLGILVTMDADQGLRALKIIRPRTAIPIHYDDYTVFKSPLSEFQQAVEEASLGTEVFYLDRGQTYTFDVGADRLR